MNVDELLIQIWNPGRYQLLIYILLSFNYYQVSMNNLCMVFYISPPVHYCHIDSKKSSKWIKPNSTEADCFVQIDNDSHSSELKNLPCPDGWDYEFSGKEWNLVSEWDLVCDNAYQAGLLPSIYFVGSMVGGIIFGYLADVFGRKKIMLSTLYITVGIGISLYFVYSYYIFIILRFIQGATVQGLQGTTSVLIMEFLTPDLRSSAGILIGISLAIGCLILGTTAYILQQWRLIQLLLSVPYIATIGYIWIIPESLRWLLANQRYDLAKVVLQKFLKFNRIVLPREITDHLQDLDVSQNSGDYGALELLKTPVIRKYSLINFYEWFSNSWVYYGLTLSIPTLSGDKYLNFLLGTLIELPSYCIAYFVLKRFGRKNPLFCYYAFCGLACIAAGTIPSQVASEIDISWLKTGFALIGRAAINGCLSIMFLYTSELFPTVLRNVAVGACLFWEPLGGVIAPLMILLGQYTYPFIPIVIFGLMSFTGAFLYLLLPETLHKPMPNTVEETECLGSSHKTILNLQFSKNNCLDKDTNNSLNLLPSQSEKKTTEL